MAIKRTALSPRMAEVGKIKIGGKGETRKSKDGKPYQLPIKYDHFIVTTTEKGEDGNYIEDGNIMERIGNTARELRIRLLFDDIDMNFHTSFAMYAGKKRICYGDGEMATRTKKDGTVETVPCSPDTCEFFQAGKCKVSGILSCALPDAMELGGVYRFRTHSWNSVSSILAALDFFSANTNGILQGLPLKLKMVKKATEEHGTIDYVTVVLDGLEMVQMRRAALEEFQNRNILGIEMKKIEQQVLESGFLSDDHDTDEDIETEFYTPDPEPVDVTPTHKGTGADELKDRLNKIATDKKTASAKKKETTEPVAASEEETEQYIPEEDGQDELF